MAMTEAEAEALLERIRWIESALCDADDPALQTELEALHEQYATEWLGG